MNSNTTTSKIAFDLSPLYDGNAVRGVGVYTDWLVKSLTANISKFPDLDIHFINQPSDLFGYDLIHYPYFDPFQLTLPSHSSIPYVITVHDLTPRQYPKQFPVGIKGEIKWLIQRHRLRQSRLIITDSLTSKSVIHQLTDYPLDKIHHTYLAADSRFKPRSKTSSLLQNFQQKYHLPPKFVLYCGDINWNKNIPHLVRACLNLQYPLIIVGSAATKIVPLHPWTKDIHWLQNIQKKPENKSLIHLTGFVPDKDFPLFYNLATLYCQPSYAEGFGFPLVQAMQSGCPLCYSLSDTVAEIVSDCGLKFDPFSISNIQLSLSQMWNSPSLRTKFVKKGIYRASQFSWTNTATQTLQLYRQALYHEK